MRFGNAQFSKKRRPNTIDGIGPIIIWDLELKGFKANIGHKQIDILGHYPYGGPWVSAQ